MRLGHKPVFGLLESNYFLPLRYAPLELEFTIVSDEHAPVITPFATRDAAGDLIKNAYTDKYGYYFTTGDTSTQWELKNVIIRAEVIQLDNTVNNNIVRVTPQSETLERPSGYSSQPTIANYMRRQSYTAPPCNRTLSPCQLGHSKAEVF